MPTLADFQNRPMNRGKWVVVDGPSGSGKDSLLSVLQQRLLEINTPFSYISEEDLDPDRQQILTAAGDRAKAELLVDHRFRIWHKYVYPALMEGRVVLSNRGEPATLAYQTASGEISISQVWEMHRHRGISRPDLVVITVCRPDAALLRREQDQAASGSIRAERERGRGLSGKFTGERQELIHRQYFEVRRFLEEKNVPVLLLDTEKMSVGQEADAVLRLL